MFRFSFPQKLAEFLRCFLGLRSGQQQARWAARTPTERRSTHMNDRTYRQEHEEALLDVIVQDMQRQRPLLAGEDPERIRASLRRTLADKPDAWRALGQQYLARAEAIERYMAERKKKQP
jgi:hypothetical protein